MSYVNPEMGSSELPTIQKSVCVLGDVQLYIKTEELHLCDWGNVYIRINAIVKHLSHGNKPLHVFYSSNC